MLMILFLCEYEEFEYEEYMELVYGKWLGK